MKPYGQNAPRACFCCNYTNAILPTRYTGKQPHGHGHGKRRRSRRPAKRRGRLEGRNEIKDQLKE